MRATSIGFSELDSWLERAPVMASLHPLAPLALDPSVAICADGHQFLHLLDDRRSGLTGKVCVIDTNCLPLQDRLPCLRVDGIPSPDAINAQLPGRLDYARTHLLTNHQVPQHIHQSVTAKQPSIVALMLVDGLSYADTMSWRYSHILPCFVDGPSVTFRFDQSDPTKLNPNVGFSALVGTPSIWARLQSLGYSSARGYTYWSPGSNKIADYLFTGVPYQRIANFDTILQLLESAPPGPGTYLQIVREGLDGLAHSKRELQRIEIDSAIQAIKHDIDRLATFLSHHCHSFQLFVVSDHGIIWKGEVDLQRLDSLSSTHSRYLTLQPPASLSHHFIQSSPGPDTYYLCRFPYLAGTIPADDSGLHGGLSYQESFVPLITLSS